MAETISLRQWLKDKNVSNSKYVYSKLEQKQVSLNSLLTSDEPTLQSILGPDGARLPSTYLLSVIKAVRKTPHSYLSSGGPAKPSEANAPPNTTNPTAPPPDATTPNSPKTQTTSAAPAEEATAGSNDASGSFASTLQSEADLLAILKHNFDDVSNAVAGTQDTIQSLKKSSQTLENEINIEFERMINLLNEKKSFLLTQLSNQTQTQLDSLQTQLTTLTSQRDTLSQTKKDFVSLSNHSSGGSEHLPELNKLVHESLDSLESSLSQTSIISSCALTLRGTASSVTTNHKLASSLQNTQNSLNTLNKLNARNINMLPVSAASVAGSVSSDETLSLVTSPPSEHSSVGDQSVSARSSQATISAANDANHVIQNIDAYLCPLTSRIDAMNIECICNAQEGLKQPQQHSKQMQTRLNSNSNILAARPSRRVGNAWNCEISGTDGLGPKIVVTPAQGAEEEVVVAVEDVGDDEKGLDTYESLEKNGLESLRVGYKISELDRQMLQLCGGSELSQFDAKSASRNIKIEGQGRLATKSDGVGNDFVCIKMDPVEDGIHCWRVHHADASNVAWCVVAAAKKGLSYDRARGYGANNYNQVFRFGKLQHDLKKKRVKTDVWRGKCVDILLDLEHKKLKIRCPEFDVNQFDVASIRSGMSGISGVSGVSGGSAASGGDENDAEVGEEDDVVSMGSIESRGSKLSVTTKVSRNSRTSRASRTSRNSGGSRGHSYQGTIDGKGENRFTPSVSLRRTIEFEQNVEKEVERARQEVNEVVIDKLPSNQKWILHLTLMRKNAKVKVRKIPKEWYGKFVEKVDFEL